MTCAAAKGTVPRSGAESASTTRTAPPGPEGGSRSARVKSARGKAERRKMPVVNSLSGTPARPPKSACVRTAVHLCYTDTGDEVGSTTETASGCRTRPSIQQGTIPATARYAQQPRLGQMYCIRCAGAGAAGARGPSMEGTSARASVLRTFGRHCNRRQGMKRCE